MRRSIPLIVIAFVLPLVSAPGLSHAQEAPDEAAQAMMEAWAAYGAVGAHHEALHTRKGSWKATVKFWYAPDTEPDVSTADSTIMPIMGGRYMQEDFTSTGPDGSPFQGMGLVGYDNLEQRFVAIWIDSMSTGILTADSTSVSEDFRRIEYDSEMPDPVTGTISRQRSVEYWTDDDTRVMEAYETTPEGTEFMSMQITYVRQ
jgi:hypothetical protein